MGDLSVRIARTPILRKARASVTRMILHWDRKLQNSFVWVISAALIFALQATLIITHKPWLDEYQAVQIAIEAPNITTLLEWLRYEGHPPLFYLILRGLAHIMEPLTTLPVAALIFAAIAQYAILFKSPFTRSERLLLALSHFVMFEFLTISRSMTLGVTILILTITFWRNRASWLLIALLPMCDFLFGILSVILVLLKWHEKRLWHPGIGLWLVIGMLSAWTVLPAQDMIPAIKLNGLFPDTLSWLRRSSALAIPLQGGIHPGWNSSPAPLQGIVWAGFYWFAWASSRGDQFHRFLLFGFIGLTWLFSVTVYPLPIRHLMLIALLLIVLTWLRRTTGERPGAGFRLWLAIAAASGIATSCYNFEQPFDTAHIAAAEIQKRGLSEKHWMAFPVLTSVGVTAISGIDFEQTERHCMQSFIRWDFRTDLHTPEKMLNYLTEEIDRHGQFYLLSGLNFSEIPTSILVPLAKVDGGVRNQPYYLYQVGPNAAEETVTLAPCTSGRRPFAKFE